MSRGAGTGRTPRAVYKLTSPSGRNPGVNLKIAYLINQYPRTTHSFIRREIEALEAEGHEIVRISLRPVAQELVTEADRAEARRTRFVLPEGAVAHALAVSGVALAHPVRLSRALALTLRVGRRSDRGLMRNLAYLAEACLLLRWLSAERVEHLHAHFGTNPAAVAMLCRVLGGPRYSFTVHGPEEFDRPEFLALGEKVRRASFVVAISAFGRSQLCRWARYEDWEKIEVVRCGVGRDLLDAPRTPVPEAPRFVCVARMSPEKGHLVLVEAAARLAAEGRRFELVLVGDGPLRARVEEAIAREGLGERVRLAGWMSAADVCTEIERARALVLPSFAEGLPVVIMEALALGRPVIATAVAGVPELVEPGSSGWVVPAGSSEALASAMRAALEASSERLGEMGGVGAAAVARRHDAAAEARRLAALCSRVGGA